MKRRTFLKSTTQAGVAAGIGVFAIGCNETQKNDEKTKKPMVKPGEIAICTWGFSKANETAGLALQNGKNALDAVIDGVSVEEENLKNTTVGKGGAPDREGRVTLDACVMAPNGNAGAVVCVENITNVARLARKVMEETPHVMLAGEGAEQFAYTQGFKKENLMTEASQEAYQEWLKEKEYKPIINIENHDTIGMLTLDKNGDIAGACTTSGLAYKMMGRVGDSPIIGSGLYVDNEVGGAAGTGLGEEIMKKVGSFLIVELMRNGMSPQQACEAAVMRTVKTAKNLSDFQIAYIAINKAGETGSFSLQQGFAMMEYRNGTNTRKEAAFHLKTE
ncbi:N(4)-(beta-N-acetylglucosaminyl)-L-asparaginase [Luteirhabdus pelagi]|uniref:N(4)-(beta-N-acetylglucosaminyl)-L-asparaginase n=1 Tax=Luteirhabdus pelagi TaxID=2792783 RepID=UPI00193A5310|nr:N(4)-(beta-N-acetylglucosaminyl)-L-asparaginase [Luteirhabdus pelagi]